MMLDHLGHPEAAADIVAAIERVLKESDVKTPDMGGKADTKTLSQAIVDAL
jgi:tartrate dehydrogenase/decarboxylase/D-malate dehydrogenase